MITLFQKIRQKLLEKNKVGNFLKYAIGEILLVVIGILIALQINNWNENRKIAIESNRVIQDINSEFKDNRIVLKERIADLEVATDNVRRVLGLMNAEPEEIPKAEPAGILSKSLKYGNYNPSNSSINELISSGKLNLVRSSFETANSKGLDIISNSDIRNKLIAVYDSQYDFFLKAEAEELAEVQYNMRHILARRFESGWNYSGKDTFEGSMIPLDFESLKTDQEFLYFIKTQQNRTRSYVGYFYENLRKSVASMIHDLEIEINRLDR